jgi:hypothetical protein
MYNVDTEHWRTEQENYERAAVYITGPKEWVKTSYTISLYILVVKLLLSLSPAEIRIDDFADVLAVVKSIRPFGSDISRLAKDSVEYWPIILEAFDDLFPGKSPEYYWSNSRLKAVNSLLYDEEGIQSMILGSSNFYGLHQRFNAILRDRRGEGSSRSVVQSK